MNVVDQCDDRSEVLALRILKPEEAVFFEGASDDRAIGCEGLDIGERGA